MIFERYCPAIFGVGAEYKWVGDSQTTKGQDTALTINAHAHDNHYFSVPPRSPHSPGALASGARQRAQTHSRTRRSPLLPIACAGHAKLRTPRRKTWLVPTGIGAIRRLH